jgi:hypothetical protein
MKVLSKKYSLNFIYIILTMLTKISNDLIHHFLGKSDINSLLKSDAIKTLYENLKNEYKNSKIKIEMKGMSFPTNAFIAKSIQNKLHRHKNTMTLSWTTRGRSSVRNTLHIYLDEDSEPNTKLLVDAISYITSFSDKNRKITIHLCLLPDKKIIKKNSQRLTNLNVNSGSNYYTNTESEICIFRREECIKVILHEILHGLRCSDLVVDEKITERLCQKYDLNSKDILVDESYTEIWAKILNTYFISSLTNSSTKYQHFCTMLAIEREFSLYQASKIREFVKNSKDKNLDKNTNVTAYYLVVGEIFNDLESFLNICGNDPYVKDDKACLKYLYQLEIPKKRKVSKDDKYYNTLRMSVSELRV